MGAENVERAVDFWSNALGYTPHRFPDSENEFTILVPPGGVGARVALQASEVPAGPSPRVHVDLVVDSAEEQASEVARLIGIGATETDWAFYPDDPDFVVLSDTEGNRFCVVDASHG